MFSRLFIASILNSSAGTTGRAGYGMNFPSYSTVPSMPMSLQWSSLSCSQQPSHQPLLGIGIPTYGAHKKTAFGGTPLGGLGTLFDHQYAPIMQMPKVSIRNQSRRVTLRRKLKFDWADSLIHLQSLILRGPFSRSTQGPDA